MARAFPDPSARRRVYSGEDGQPGWWLLHYAMRDLVSPEMWRKALYAGDPPPLTPLYREEATVALSRAFMLILRDWFTDTDEIDVRSLSDILRPGRRKLKSSGGVDKARTPAKKRRGSNTKSTARAKA
jgi:hypothetical protein